MKRSPMEVLPSLIALAVLLVLGAQTFRALRVTGAFGFGSRGSRAVVAPAFRTLESQLAAPRVTAPTAALRDPFMFGPATDDDSRKAPTAAVPPARVRATAPAAPPQPVLTAILYDNDPRALIRWQDRDWTVRQGGLFDEFQVVAITRTQVTLRRGNETLVLQRRNPGDTP